MRVHEAMLLQIKRILAAMGIDASLKWPPGSQYRPIGQMQAFLEDLHQRGLAPMTILDVGAHQSHWSRMAKALFPKADCFLIEPQVEMEQHLRTFCATHAGSKYFLTGAGSSCGQMTLTIEEDLAGSSFLPPPSPELQGRNKQRVTPIVTIDSLIESQQMPAPQLAKLDVQGFELEVLKGGSRLFGPVEAFILETSCYRFFEQMPLFHEVVIFMAERGYVMYDLPGFVRRPLDGALGQVDICFVPQHGFLRRAGNGWS